MRHQTSTFSPRPRTSRAYGIFLRILVIVIVLLGVGAGAALYLAGRSTHPAIEIAQPATAVGQIGELAVNVDTPNG